VWLLVVLVGCGRINFDPLGGGGSDVTGDGSGSQVTTDGSGSSGTDSTVTTACTNAMAVTANVLVTNVSSCSTSMDLIDGCGPTATQEVAFKFTPTVTASYSVRSFVAGTTNITTTMHLSATCQPGVCQGLSQTTLTAGTTYYYAYESTSGGCASIDFSITQP